MIFGNVPFMPRIPIDAKAHVVDEDVFPDPHGDKDPAIFVARRRADGGVLLLGRSLREDYDLQETLLQALAIALLAHDSPDPGHWRLVCSSRIATIQARS